jgi:hypothetical protein
VSRQAAATGLLAVSYIAWLGGLLRFAGDVAGQLLPQLPPIEITNPEALFVLGGMLLIGIGEPILPYRRPWLREQMRRNAEGLGKLYGQSPVQTYSRPGPLLRRLGLWLATILLPGILLALVLPGPVAAAISLVVGILVRIVAMIAAIAAAGDQTPYPDG